MSRHRWRVGDHLVVDDDTGFTRYRSQMRKRWDGALVDAKGFERRQPQEFVQAKSDPYAVSDIRIAAPVSAVCNTIGVYIGATTVRVPTNNAAAHLYDPGVGSMEIGCSLIVR